ncbi:MAG: YceI family protein [Acidobacteriota bacterium]|nr:YceI family protein [Acidobacteriota bacterium]
MISRKNPFPILFAGLWLFAVTAGSAQQQPQSQPSQPQGVTTYVVDAAHSNVGFTVPILNGVSKVAGKFADFAVTINYDERDITKSSVSATIKAASINTGIEKRDTHLKNADFFDVEKYPEITFQSSRIEKKGNGFVAHGAFTMHGVTKEIALPITPAGTFKNPTTNEMQMGFTAKLVINRQDYGIAWRNPRAPNFVGDLVEIELNLLTRVPPKQS